MPPVRSGVLAVGVTAHQRASRPKAASDRNRSVAVCCGTCTNQGGSRAFLRKRRVREAEARHRAGLDMKVTVERGALLKSLGHVHRVVERRNTIPILANVLIRSSPA